MKVFLKSLIRLILLVVLASSKINATSESCGRKVDTIVLCPSTSCPVNVNKTVNLVHTTAVGSHDTIHYVHSTWGIPSVLVARTSHNAELSVNYTAFLNESVAMNKKCISFSEQPYSVFVLMISQVIDYVDLNDTANMQQVNYTRTVYDLSKATWKQVVNKSHSNYDEVVFSVTQDSFSPRVQPNGSLSISFKTFCNEGYFNELPNLQYNNNMSLVDVILDNITTSGNRSRLGVTLILATNQNIGGNMSMEVRRSIDDEYSPGSFELINWLSSTNESVSDAFLQWKPASYNSPIRSIQSISSSRYYDLRSFNFTDAKRGLVVDYFGDDAQFGHHVNMFTNDVSFGLSGLKKFYRDSPYTAWSFSLGFGQPPTDHISFMIIMIILVGLGIPIVLIIAGTVYTCVKKYRHREGYEEITSSYSEIN